jgi:hypothetical protein
MPRPLPAIDEDDNEQTTPKHTVDLSDPVPSRATKFFAPGDYAYVIKVAQEGQGIAAVTVMTNAKRFTQAELDAMVAEAARITNESSVGGRRKYLAQQRIGVDPELNERVFPTDVEFFEGVLMDKWQFKQLASVNASVAIEPTAKLGVSAPRGGENAKPSGQRPVPPPPPPSGK